MRTNKRRALTLVELLVSLTIFMLVASSVYYTLMSGIRLWTRINETIAENHSLRTFFNIISRDLKCAVPYPDMECMWSSGEMAFMAIIPVRDGSSARDELARIAYRFDEAKGGIMRSCATFREGFDENNARENIVCANLDEAVFEYPFKDMADKGEYVWKEGWESDDNEVPRGVRIRVAPSYKKKQFFEKYVFMKMGKLKDD